MPAFPEPQKPVFTAEPNTIAASFREEYTFFPS
jgi:hypothetical protein